MKLYDRDRFLLTILGTVLFLALAAFLIARRDWFGVLWILAGLGFLARGLWVSLTETGYQRTHQKAEKPKGKRVREREYRRFARIAPLGTLAFVLTAALLVIYSPTLLWLSLLLWLGGMAYQAWIGVIIRKKREEAEGGDFDVLEKENRPHSL